MIVLAEIFRRWLRLKNTPNKFSSNEDFVALDQAVPPAAPGLPYEVFISFRGEDTRNNFVSHLHSALKDRGIRTYFDEDNLQKGQTIGPELLKAIQQLSIAIVVLSTNYGSSTWCLDELVKIMECKNKFRLVVFPIFYHVDPSEVRKQKNSFFQAFSIHEVNFKYDGEKVKSWREALTQVANLAGEEIRGQNEALCIKEIGDKILKQLPVKASHFRKSCVGIEQRIREIKKLMDTKPEEVLYIGLWGMGGIGKTTTARAIFEDCKDEFEGSCLLQDVKKSKDRMENVQSKLLSNVLKTKIEDICDVVIGSSMIQERLKFKKVLIVIDDVDDVEQLNALAGQCDWFGRGSKIIITTRDEHLINDHHIEKYDIQTLPENEALHLYCLHAFKNDIPLEDFKELSHQVLKYAGGLPLALQVLGGHLYRRDTCFWKSVLRRLKDLPNDKIISRLQISFEGLSVLQQNIFLDIACGFRGKNKDEVEERLQILGLHPKEGMVVLIQKSLIYIKMDIFNCTEIIEMHDLLQEMGWDIVRKKSNGDVTKYSRLWLMEDVLKVLSNINVSSEAERIYIDFYLDNGSTDNATIKANFGLEAFRNMNKLSFLHLFVIGDFYMEKYDERNCDVNVSQPFGQFGNELRWLSWDAYPWQSLPERFYPVNLVQLRMQSSRITETPDFSHMPNLEIKRINLEYCANLEEFPKINWMKSLEILDLSFTNLQSFPEIYGKLDSLRKLLLKRKSIYGLPTPNVGNTTGLQKLVFTSPAVNFPGLVRLKITGSGIVRTLDFSNLPYLEKLDLSDSQELVEVHASLGVHKRIKSINLSYCSKLEEFPTIVDMESLKELNLLHTRLQNFPEIEGNVKCLVRVDLSQTEIRTLPRSIEHATNLENLRMINCKYLVTLPISSLGVQLQTILIGSGSLKYFKENRADEDVSRQNKKPKLLICSEGMGQLSTLHVYFVHCKSLEELPESLLSRMELLFIKDCRILTGWICLNLMDLLDKYQHLCFVLLHQYCDLVLHQIIQAFSERESMSNMLRRRKKPFTVCIPRGRGRIPSLFQYEFRGHRVTVYLPPLSDKLKRFLISGINADLQNKFELPTYDPFDRYYYRCGCHGYVHVVVMYIPIDNIRRDIGKWDGQNECTLLELQSKGRKMAKITCRWGLSLVYSEGEVNEVDPHQLMIAKDDIPYSGRNTFRVKLAGSRERMEKLNNLISYSLFQQQSHL